MEGFSDRGSTPLGSTTSPRTAYRSRRLFYKKSPLTHSVAAPFSNRTRCAGLRFGFACRSVSCGIHSVAMFQSKSTCESRCFSFGSHRLISMLGAAKPPLRQGFAKGKTLVRRISADGQKAAICFCAFGIFTYSLFTHSNCLPGVLGVNR